jgi:hypothetical protein
MKRLLFFALAGFFISFAPIEASAKHDKYKQELAGSSIRKDASLEVVDGRYNEMSTGNFLFTNVSVDNELMLAIDLKSGHPTSDFTTKVDFQVRYEEWSGTAFVLKTETGSLTVNYTTQGTFRDKAIYRFKGGHKATVTVTNVSGDVGMLVLVNSVSVRRFDRFDANVAVSGIASELLGSRGELLVKWDALVGAEEYDLEWVWINDYGNNDETRSASAIAIDKNIFRINSSRITITGTQHAVPLIYERGYVIFRVRGIGRGGQQFTMPLEGKWSFVPAAGATVASAPNKFLFYGHQENLNWQSTINYAEEGKNKTAVKYFDGTLRNRQAVSKTNSEDQIVVGETLFDHQGREAVQVVPVPAQNSKIGYQRSFNQNLAGKPYGRDDFDVDKDACDVSPQGISTVSGASQYYSAQNPDKSGAQAFVPDAQQYPFTQTEFTPDNTGRIRRQSGIGPDYKLGSGHETKYYYGKPLQEELDKMFGNDVGYAERYKKNMVRDANGQISVTYLDPQGRVIATALAGETPANIHDIAKPEEVVTTTADLLGKRLPADKVGMEDRVAEDGRSRTLSRELLVSQDGTRMFQYDVATGKYTETCVVGPPKPICYGCVIDVTVSITNECGEEVIPAIGSNGSITTVVGTIDKEINTNQARFSKSFATLTPLEAGNYSITRKISINEQALDVYTADFLSKEGECFLTFDHFLAEESKNIQMFDCQADCQSCRDAVGEYGKYTGPNCNPCLTPQEYQDLVATCDFLCDDQVVQCANALNMMLADVSPFGQYGEIMQSVGLDDNGAVSVPAQQPEIDPSQFPLSIFNEANQLPKNKAGVGNWRFPKDGMYLTEAGEPAVVDVLAVQQEDGSFVFTPEVESDAIPADVRHGDVFQVPPHKLAQVKSFVANWDPAWANQLVQFHPEYGYYNFCTIAEESHRWDAKFLSVDTYEEAVQNGYLSAGANLKPSPLTAGTNLSDPYFFQMRTYLETHVSSSWTSYNAKELEAMTRSLNNYTMENDLWYAVHRTVNCPFDDSKSSVCQICPAYDGINTDQEWNTFKSLYFSLKQQFMERKMSLYAINNDCYNGCIGSEAKYNPFGYSFYKNDIFGFIKTLSLLNDSDQPCNWNSWKSGLYKDKDKRFPLSTDMIDVSDLDLEACYTGFDTDTPSDVETISPDQQAVCSNSLRDILEDATLKGDIGFYETCGQCPIVFDLQTLLDALAKRNELDNDNVQLSCYPQSNYPEFVPDLKTALEQTLPGDGIWLWDKVSTSNGELVGNLEKNTGGTCEVRLKISTPGIDISAIESICCMNYTDHPSFYPLTGKGNFFVKAGIRNRTEKVTVEGFISCVDLTTCPFPPKCEPVKDASELQTLMNALLFDFTLGGKSDDLFSADPINLNVAPYKTVVEGTLNAMRTTLTGSDWTWKSSTSGNVLSGYIEDGKGGSCLVELRPDIDVPFDVRRIIGFSNIRPNREHPDDPQKNFLITAIVETDQGKVRVKMRGYSGCFAIGTCTPVVQKP